MSDRSVDHEHMEITGKHKSLPDSANLKVEEQEQVKIVITQAYGPDGDQLVGISDQAFDGYPALTLLVRASGREGLVHLSPIHGDDRKAGFTDIPVGTKCQLFCPNTKKPLEVEGPINDQVGESGGVYYAIYLTPALSKGSSVLVSNIWGHYHSRVVHDFELISHWANQHDDLDRD